ncbi:MAG TPA: PA14 domain-containing protein [Planctomycetota bacterium]|nr:PA14 domain-containing protein [Planctomycetota bacterium]
MLAAAVVLVAALHAWGAAGAGLKFPPLPLLLPTAFTADAGDGRAYLRWNLQIEDSRVIGWKVLQVEPERKTMTPQTLTQPEYVVRGLANGTRYTFAAVGILADGSATPPSNTASVVPRPTGTATVTPVGRGYKITVGDLTDVELTGPGARVVFPDGQELIYDNFRPIDWKTVDGEHLIYPKQFGNGLDIGKFDKRGLPMIIPPEGLKRTTMAVGDQTWTTSPPTGSDNFSIRWTGFILPKFSETYTFHATTDDGVRLWIGDDLIINNWTNKPPTETAGRIKLEAAKKYPFKMEYFEGAGGASCQLEWSSNSQPRQIVPTACLFPPDTGDPAGSQGEEGTGLQGTYFEGSDLVMVKLTRLDPQIDFKWGGDGPFGDGTKPVEFYYRDMQFGFRHPHITDPLTIALSGGTGNDNRARFLKPQVDGNRVTFHYWMPLVIDGYRSWNFVLVWETWWPIERDRHGSVWHGLARQVDVMMPGSWRLGYQVMLNDGFGPDGSRNDVVSYSSGFREPGYEIVDFSGDKNKMVYFQSPRPPRQGYGYHPDGNCLQGSPLIFYDWGKGSDNRKGGCMTIAARSEYYHCSNASASYVEEGADGVWPNLAWDMALAGKRTWVDTVEYMYTADVAQPLPQRYINARFEALGDVSRRMGVQDEVGVITGWGTHWEAKERHGGLIPYAENYIKRFEGKAVDGFHNYHEFWHAVPITVEDQYRLDENYDCNAELKKMCDMFNTAGMKPGFWFRPEFTKTSVACALSPSIPTAETYYGYAGCEYPDVTALLHERGIPLFRENPNWARRQSDGSWPTSTPYQWIPMAMSSEWWDRIMWPTLKMSKQLGFHWVLMDGGFGGLQGVEYALMLDGKTDAALPAQPFWWRMFRTMKMLDVRTFGECTVGWKGAFVNLAFKPQDNNYLWMFHASCAYNGGDTSQPERIHKLYQLYNGCHFDEKAVPVHRYAKKFFTQNRPPDWVELKNLRLDDAVKTDAAIGESPVAGDGATRVRTEDVASDAVRPWTWDDAVWHYDDGTEVIYPAYDKIDWSKE